MQYCLIKLLIIRIMNLFKIKIIVIDKTFFLGLFLILFFGNSCKEVYNPNLDEANRILVVDGLITDESNVIKVKISNTVPFRNQAYLPEQAALVIVSDDLGRKFSFVEKTPGNYESKAFEYEYGRTYTLIIKTTNSKYYRSTPQTLYPKFTMDPVYHEVTTKTMQTTRNGKLVMQSLPGLEFFTNLNDSVPSSPYYRFSSIVLVEYTEKQHWFHAPDSLRFLFYFWKKYYPNQFFNLNEPGYNNLSEHKHSIAFCPIDTTFFTVVKEEIWTTNPPPKLVAIYFKNFYYFVITIKKYQLNADVYQYYKDINKQLESKNRIFDPVSFQITGNITCDNDPEEPVLGVFEVSSTNMRTYSFSNFRIDKTVKYNEIIPMDLQNIADTGSLYNQFPPYWISGK